MYKILHEQKYHVIKKVDNGLDRHIILILEKNDKKYFYKELNNEDSSRFEEQIAFQYRVEESKSKIILPKLFDYDLKSERKWGLWEYLPGKHLADWQSRNVENLEKWLEPIVDVLIELEKIKPFKEEYDITDRLILRVNQWTEEPIKEGLLTLQDRNKVINLIEKNRQNIVVGFSHTDFTPWHMHEIKFPKFALVDYENCKNKPKFYDLAYFYQRVYTKLDAPELAENFLKIYKSKAKMPGDFENRFLPILGQRIIGGFYDCLVLKDRTDIEVHNKLLGNLFRSIK